MEIDAIKSLKSSLADLTYILFVIGKELKLVIDNAENAKANDQLRQTISVLQDSNSDVIRLYHEINAHEVEIKEQWYNDETTIKSLQSEVNNLADSIKVLLSGNNHLLKNIQK